MPSPRDDPYLLEVWQKLEKEYRGEGLSRWGAIKRIAQNYSVSLETVYTWLTPEHKTRKNKLTLSEEYKKKKRDWAKIPENRKRLSNYSKSYYRTRRDFPSYLIDLSIERNSFTLLALSERLKDRTKIHFDKSVLVSEIAKYNLNNPDNPLIEIEPEFYKFEKDII